jgi:hypothetical protein
VRLRCCRAGRSWAMMLSSGLASSGDIINDYENRSGCLSISCVSGENPGAVTGKR